ncbi:MAG: radical SAM protein [Syntrophales bacterium]
MKVFLFNPPGPRDKAYTREGRCTQEAGVWATQWPPVSLTTAAALLEKDGHQVMVTDLPASGLDKTSLEVLVKKYQPDFVFWNTGTPTLDFDLSLAGLIKRTAPKAITGVIGTHVTVLPEKALQKPFVDIIIRHEPEQIIRNICRNEGPNRQSIPGISWRDPKDGRIHHNPDEPFWDPEEIPPPAWHTLDISPYRLPLKGRPFLIVAPVRGCPYSCNFCTAPVYYGRKLRKRPIRNVLDEIEENVSRYKIREFFIWADTFTADRDYVKQFCRAIMERNLRISWTCNSRVDTVDSETLALMKEAGLWMISFGLESGNDKVLAMTGKGITVAQSKAAVMMAHRTGLKVAGHFILGLPGETEETMAETLALALNLPLDIAQFYVATPFPGTKLYEEAIKGGWLPSELDPNLSQDRAFMELPGLSTEKVNSFRRMAYKKFYIRPGILFGLLSMLEWGAISHFSLNLRRFLRYNFRSSF